LTDDTVLEEHYEDPRLLQIKLLGEGGLDILFAITFRLLQMHKIIWSKLVGIVFICSGRIHLEGWNSRHHIQTIQGFVSGNIFCFYLLWRVVHPGVALLISIRQY
jgi:hypothetical protein